MITPSTWSLNLRGLDWLNAEANAWFGIMAKATTTQDKADAKAYLDAVIAERDQRLASYNGGILSTMQAGIMAPFEALGGSAGPGAAGLSSAAVDTATAAGKTALKFTGNVATVAVIAVAVAAFVYFGGLKRGRA